MPLIRGRRIALPLEHMPQMPAAIRAHNLRPHHAKRRILMPHDGARHRVEKGGPAAAGLEFLLRRVERRVAAGARVDARGGGVLVVFAAVGGFGALGAEDAELLCFVG